MCYLFPVPISLFYDRLSSLSSPQPCWPQIAISASAKSPVLEELGKEEGEEEGEGEKEEEVYMKRWVGMREVWL